MITPPYIKVVLKGIFIAGILLMLIFSCSKRNNSENKLDTKESITIKSKTVVDSSTLVKVRYDHGEGKYYDKAMYAGFSKWFNELNRNYVCEPDIAHELYINNKFSDNTTNAIYNVPGGPDFYFLYAHLLQRKNGVETHSKLRENLTGIFTRINAIHRNLHSDGSYIYFSFQRTAIAAYTEYAIYNYIHNPDVSGKRYSIDKQRALYLQILKQKALDELQELEKIQHSQYARMDNHQRMDHKKATLLLIEELGSLIRTNFDLRVAQKFQYSYY